MNVSSTHKVVDFFDALAPSWGKGSSCDGHRIQAILDVAVPEPGLRVLDIGCGAGVLVPYLMERGVAHIYEVDIAPKMIETARVSYPGAEKIEFLLADANTAQLPAADAAVVFNAFPHFADPCRLFGNLMRALPVGGRVTVAHDRSRAFIDAHHAMHAAHVSSVLPPAADLAQVMASCGLVPDTMIDDEIYLVSAHLSQD